MSSPSTIESVLVENRVFPPSDATQKAARVSGMAAYEALCAEADKDYEGYWARLARENVVWTKPFTQVLDQSNAPFFKWFADGELNASANCLDKHIGTPVENKTAIIFEADGGEVTKVTYKELLARVSQFANALKARGVQKGDRVLIYMPMTIEGVVAMQACARIGATHSVVFGGFSAKSLQERIVDVGASLIITADEQVRGGKTIPLKPAVEEAIARARQFDSRVLLESYHEGLDLRIVVIGFEVVAAAIRRPAEVIGDGRHSIGALIEAQSRRRQAATGGESRIPLDSETQRTLHDAGYDYDRVLPTGTRLAVRKTANLHTGGSLEDVTAILHPTLRDAAIRAARALDIPVVGLDLLVTAADAPDYVFIEANERCGLANHEPQPTAERFIDLLFPLSQISA